MDPVRELIGCRIKTHYGTGGIVTEVVGPYHNGFYTVVFKVPHNDNNRCINSVRVKDSVVLCEGVPLTILGRADDNQMSLFDYCT